MSTLKARTTVLKYLGLKGLSTPDSLSPPLLLMEDIYVSNHHICDNGLFALHFHVS
jgi:hypothetical protein